jgi:predicted CXXCH cytochrome family protein
MNHQRRGLRHRFKGSLGWLAGILVLAVVGVVLLVRDFPNVRSLFESEPDSNPVAYVEDRLCANCHSQEYTDWRESHHDLAMQDANDESVLGDFDNASFNHQETTTRFFRRDGGFFVNTEGPDGTPADFQIAYTFGVEPLQQYLIPFPGGRLQALSIAWDTESKRWFHLYPDQEIEPADPFHWTGPYQNWNLMCAECHSTNIRKNYNVDAGLYETSWDAIDVGCQACHGPGASHLGWAGLEDSSGTTAGTDMGLMVRFSPGNGRAEIETCAPCHSRRSPVSVRDAAGEPFLDHFIPELLLEGLYHPDGQILDEVYVYGSFLQSRMYAEGVGCTDCHNPHSLEPRALGNQLCVQCHNALAPPNRFPSMATSDYDSAQHHFHSAESEGSLCVNCHMPERTYMVVDPRRDHSFRIPRPDLTVRLGTPNACNSCHADQTAEWATETIEEWYGREPRTEPHYGEILAAGRTGNPNSLGPLVGLASDTSQPAIVRATAVGLLADYGVGGIQGAFSLVADSDDLVRAAAVRSMNGLGPNDKVQILSPLLNDPVRAVRTAAARALASAQSGFTRPEDLDSFGQALAEYEATQMTLADTPAGQMNLGIVHAGTGQIDLAIRNYETVINIDADFWPAYLNLATLLNQASRNSAAESVLLEAVGRSPENGDAHYSLGLLRAEMGRLEDASLSLERAAALLPEQPRVRYNFGLALQQLGRRAGAETQLRAAYAIESENPAFLEALTIFYVQNERWREALPYAEGLVGVLPLDPRAAQLVERIRVQVEND